MFAAYSARLQTILTHPANRGRPLFALARAAGWMFRSHVLKRPDTIQPFPGVRMRRYTDSHCAQALSYYGNYPGYDIMKLIERFLREGDAFLDLGANIGIFTCLGASLVGATGRVESFEPAPKTYARLAENVALNGWSSVHLHQSALGSAAGQITFTTGGDALNHVSIDASPATKLETVPICALDDTLEDIPYILAKLDVEGYELPCLEGARRLLANGTPPLWLIEVNGSAHRYGFREEDLFALLRSYGYRLGRYVADTNRVETSPPLWDDILAFSARGEGLLRERMPHLIID